MVNLPFGKGDVCFLKIMLISISSRILIIFYKEFACKIQSKINNTGHSCGYELLRNVVYSERDSFREFSFFIDSDTNKIMKISGLNWAFWDYDLVLVEYWWSDGLGDKSRGLMDDFHRLACKTSFFYQNRGSFIFKLVNVGRIIYRKERKPKIQGVYESVKLMNELQLSKYILGYSRYLKTPIT